MFSEVKQKKYKALLRFDSEQNKVVIDFANTTPTEAGTCPMCKGILRKYTGKYGDFYKCDNKDCDFSLSGTFAGKKFTKNELQRLLAGENVTGNFKSKAGKKFTANAKLENGKITLIF